MFRLALLHWVKSFNTQLVDHTHITYLVHIRVLSLDVASSRDHCLHSTHPKVIYSGPGNWKVGSMVYLTTIAITDSFFLQCSSWKTWPWLQNSDIVLVGWRWKFHTFIHNFSMKIVKIGSHKTTCCTSCTAVCFVQQIVLYSRLFCESQFSQNWCCIQPISWSSTIQYCQVCTFRNMVWVSESRSSLTYLNNRDSNVLHTSWTLTQATIKEHKQH